MKNISRLTAIIIGSSIILIFVTPKTNRSTKVLYCSPQNTLTTTKPVQNHRTYCLVPKNQNENFSAHTPTTYAFSIIDDQGGVVKDFSLTHTKPLHVIIVRKDLQYFEHLHPTFNTVTGEFTLSNVIFPTDGAYRIFADFAPAGAEKDHMGMPRAITASHDVIAGNVTDYQPETLGSEERTKKFENIQVTLSSEPLISNKETTLTFTLQLNGKPVTDLQEYLGALGHSVVLHEGTLAYIHVHPAHGAEQKQNGNVDFMLTFPESGKYKIFTQFEREGKIITTNFVVSVAQGGTTSEEPTHHLMPEMHAAH